MKFTKRSAIFSSIASSFVLSAAFIQSTTQVFAQMPQQMGGANPSLGMIFYPVERGPDGQQYITTRAGYKVAVPGLGIDPNAKQIAVFTDPQNHYWYVDKNNNPTPVSAQQMQSVMSQIQGQAMQRGQAQFDQYPQNMPPQNYNAAPVAAAAPAAPAQQQSSNNGANTAMMSGLAAAGGAAVGSMLTNSMYNNNNSQYGYNGMPYGQPIYREPTGQYYYANQTGTHVPVYPPDSTSSMYNQQAASNYYQQQQQQEQQNKEAAAGYYNKQQQQQQANKEAAAGYAKQQQSSPTGAAAGAAQEKEGNFERRRRGKEASQASGSTAQALSSSGAAQSRTAQSRTADRGRRRRLQQLNR